jgi:hypothetical protein
MSTAAAKETDAQDKETLSRILRLKLADGDHCSDASSAATAETEYTSKDSQPAAPL